MAVGICGGWRCCLCVQVIEQTNDLKRLELELEQEEVRIMTEMTRVVAVSKVSQSLSQADRPLPRAISMPP